jgi:hypothetical protein
MNTRPNNLRDLRQWVRDRLRVASRDQTRQVNMSDQVNTAESINVGGKGTRRFATTRQRFRVKQDPQGTVEEVETKETKRQD